MMRPTLRALLAVAVVCPLAGCAGTFGRVAGGYPAETGSAPRFDLRGLSNLGRVDDGLYRSAQPTAEGFVAAKALGIKTVVNLCGCKTDPALAGAAGLEVVEMRTGCGSLDEDLLLRFLRVATDASRRPVLVHCAAGHDRTGTAVAAYRVVVSGWTADQALAEMRAFGAAPWYPRLGRLIRGLDVPAMRARLGLDARPAGRAAANVREGP
jgi:protein tyrosine phosphatase (PTP) superfamily phosphohydrolase (DUF442 family)